MLPLLASQLATEKNVDRLGEAVSTLGKMGLGVLVAGGTFMLLRTGYRRLTTDMQEDKATDAGTPAYYAAQIGKAIHTGNLWWGWLQDDDEEYLYNILRSVPASQWERVETAFRQIYHVSLSSELLRALSTDEYTKALSIINSNG
ncbi:hypothetical protein [Catalinimonas niigatensis]|uniref:hypothetical protein n=1 Tax=Catalinimonas niigatensis TaxID=1397264 RepID=UPI00266527C2|nr:hypothetical protein [Catalinimonas niigatensis]WPP48949.1 hypothetical protein PZB72_19980 [Catalinimonas niigatensis]